MVTLSREFQIFVKPVGPECNLRCSYCYYLDVKDLYEGRKACRMNDEILEKYIMQHAEASTGPVISFSWHGGEPLLAGTEFFRKAIGLQKKYIPEGKTVLNGIQTNGTLIDVAWCRFLAAENFFVGISIDGPGHLHNIHRRKANGDPAFNDMLKGYRLLQKSGIHTEILCVVSNDNVKYPLEVYNFFRKLKAKFITFLPLVEKEMESGSNVTATSVRPDDFGKFLCKIFDEWIEHDIGRVKIQIFEEALRTAFNQDHTLCIFKRDCGGVPVVEHNGDFYSCDHYTDNDHLIGNIRDITLSALLDSRKQQSFGRYKSLSLPEFCKRCEVLSMCNGECPKNRFIRTPDGEPGLNYLCAGYKSFFTHCRPFIEAVSTAWISRGED
jgi:uncharacterized protein